MGIPATVTLIFGEITLEPSDKLTASLPCQFKESERLSILVLDESGRAVVEKNFEVDETTEALMFDVSSLVAGTYHTWIYVAGQTFIREFQMEPEAGTGFFDKLLRKFR
ncbi:MAG: hypothetical protein HY842_02340 [Bacteroidetes bacterium]|nr:hypothetical protein [Bacteroidota bacterium]